jgi:Tol biopolymer transport system component
VFAVSPDGGTLAWIRYGFPGVGDIYLTSMQGGEPRRLTDWAASVGGLAWTPDSREIVYSVAHGGPKRLFRIAANGRQPGRGSPIQGISAEADFPSMSRHRQSAGVRLAFRTLFLDIDLQMMDLAAPRDGGTIRAHAFSPSTRVEGSARFSPDGNRIAFVSYRSGNGEIWLAERDGSGLRRLTDLGAQETVVSSWSPDGTGIAFTATVNGDTDIYTVAIDGGRRPLRLTTDHPSMETFPSYSADGSWIYFSKGLTGGDLRVWRIPVKGGQASQVAYRGGLQPQESPDGRDLFYLDRIAEVSGVARPSNLMKMPVGGGPEVIIQVNVPAFAWSVTDQGILFVNREPAGDAVDLYRFADQTVTRVGRLDFRLPGIFSHMTFSRDGRHALGTRMVRNDTDLMLIDDFR